MARVYSSSALIESAVRKAMLPETQITFTETDFLAFANEEMDMAIIPYILSFHEDYYQTFKVVQIQGNKTKYKIPYRAIGNKLRYVHYQDSNGNLYPMHRILIEDLSKVQDYGQAAYNVYYYLENDEIVLLSSPNVDTGFLRITYYQRPNALVPDNKVSKILGISGNQVTVTNINLYTVGLLVDIVSAKSPNRIVHEDLLITGINTITNTLTLSSSPANIELGDQLSIAETTAIAQIPTELQSLLSQRVAARCLEALGDQAGLQVANTKIAEIEQKAATLIDSRVEGSPWKVIASSSPLKSIRRRFWWRR
jgi:hypothetical protein